MADRRHQIATLRAKAASTSFPAEAEACRAKADELEAELAPPSYAPPAGVNTGIGAVDDFMRRHSNIYQAKSGDVFDAAGGGRAHFYDWPFDGTTDRVQVRVTNVSGSSYTIWVE